MSYMIGDVIQARRNNHYRRVSPPRRPANPVLVKTRIAVKLMSENLDAIEKICAKPIIDLTCLPSIFDKTKVLSYTTFKTVFNQFYNDHYNNLNNFGYSAYAARLKNMYEQLLTIDSTLEIKNNHQAKLNQAMYKDAYSYMYADQLPAEVWLRIMFNCELSALVGLSMMNKELHAWTNQIGKNHSIYFLIKDGYYLRSEYELSFSDVIKSQKIAKAKKQYFEFFLGRNTHQERLDFVNTLEACVIQKELPVVSDFRHF